MKLRLPHRRRLWTAAALLSGLLALGLFPQEPLRRWVEGRLRAALGPQVRIGRLHVVPIRLLVEAEDVSIRAPGFDADVPRARLNFQAGSLLGRGLLFDDVSLDGPRLVVRATPAGGPAAASTTPIQAVALTVRGGAFAYEHADATRVELTDVAARGAVGPGRLDLTASSARIARAGGPSLDFQGLHAVLASTPQLDLALESLEASAGRSTVRAHGDLGRVGAWRLALTLDARLHLADVGLPNEQAVDGEASFQARVEGTPQALSIEGSLDSERVHAAGWLFESARVNVHHETGAPGETRGFLTAKVAGGRLALEGSAKGATLEARATLSGADAETLRRRIAPGAGPLPGALDAHVSATGKLGGSFQTQGAVDARVRPRGPGLTAHVAWSGPVRASDGAMDLEWRATADAVSPAGSLRHASLAAEGTAVGTYPPRVDGTLGGTASLVSARPVDLAYTGSVQARAGVTSLRIEAEGPDARANLDAVVRGGRAEKLSLEGEARDLAALRDGLRGRAAFSVAASGPIAQLTGRGELRSEEVGFGDARLGAVTGDVTLDRGRARFTLNAPEAGLTSQGDLAGAQVRAHVTSTATPLASLNREGVEGSLTGAADVAFPLSGPGRMQAAAQVTALELRRAPFEAKANEPFAATLVDGRVGVAELSLETSAGPLDLSGSLDVADKSFDVRAKGTLDLARLPERVGWKLEGAGDADVHATGTLDRPRVAGTVAIRDLRVSGPRVPETHVAEGRVELAGDRVRLPGIAATLAGGTLSVEGEVPLASVWPGARRDSSRISAGEGADLRISWKDCDAGALLDALRGQAQPDDSAVEIEGLLTGAAGLQGGLAAATELSGRLTSEATSLTLDDLAVGVSAFTLTAEQGRLLTSGVELGARDARVRIEGAVDFVRRELALTGRGGLDLRLFSPFLEDASLTGTGELDLALGGTFDAPRPRGTFAVRDGALRLRMLRQSLTALQGRASFDGERVQLERLTARLGGGTLEVGGSFGLDGKGLRDVAIEVAARDVALRYPAALRTRLDANLALAGRTGAFALEGRVEVQRGLYDASEALETSLFAKTLSSVPRSSPFLRTFALDLEVATLAPLLVRSDLGTLQARGDFRLLGDLDAPAAHGRLALVPRGELTLAGHAFRVESGSLEYRGTWDAGLDVRASSVRPVVEVDPSGVRRSESRYDVDVRVGGTLAAPSLELSARPGRLTSEQVLSLLVTRTTRSEALRSGGAVAGEQLAQLLTGRLGRGLGAGLRSLGVDEVSIQPQLVARDADPGARFTFGKRFGPSFRLIYSASLNDPEQRFVKAEAGPLRTLTASAQRRDDGTFAYEAGQQLEFGGRQQPPPSRLEDERVRIETLTLDGAPPSLEPRLRARLDVRPGGRVTRWELLDRAEALRGELVAAGYLEAEVGARLDGSAAVVDVRPGPRFTWRVEGVRDAPDPGPAIREALFEEEALERGRDAVQRALWRRGYLRARVEARSEGDTNERRLVFAVEPGPAQRVEELRFPGATLFSDGALARIAGGPGAVLTEPELPAERWRAAYRERQHLEVEIGVLGVRADGDRLWLEVPIDEGHAARVAAVRLKGATLDEAALLARLELRAGDPFDPGQLAPAALRLRDHYLALGYPSARVTSDAVPNGADVELSFEVHEGERATLQRIDVAGARHTRESVLRERITIAPGSPLDLRALAASERRLLELGTLARAHAEPLENASAVRFEVEELPLFELRYSARYQDDQGASGQLDAEWRHLLGRGLTLGGRYQRGRDDEERRGFLQLPTRLGDITFSASRLREDFQAFFGLPPFTEEFTNTRVQRVYELQHQTRLVERWVLLSGYRFKRLTSSLGPDFPFQIDIAGVNVSLLRETRDSPLDARRGRFLSLNLQYNPAALGSDLTFVKGFAQAFVHRSFGPLTWSQAYRLGLAHGFHGQDIISTERFFAGGANSLRGFATDGVGPLLGGEPAGGEAVLVLNQELRVRHASGVGAALFYDAGNVFPKAGDLSLDLRHALGVGLRYASPVGLLRLDVGFPLGRRENEKSYRWFFSIGQAY